MYDMLALIRLDVLGPTLRAHVVTTTTPNVGPLGPIRSTAIIVDELSLRYFSSWKRYDWSYLASG
jgi:hypothetical protein